MASSQALEERRAELEAELGEPITVDGLTATWRIFQRKRGHRHSTDDLLTAWYALTKFWGCCPETSPLGPASPKTSTLTPSCEDGQSSSSTVTPVLDLGTGIGTVGLLVLAASPSAMLTCVEAQEISFRFLRENIHANEAEHRVRAIFGDLRTLSLPDRFPLVTGSPPYFDIRAGIVPADSQKAHARFELRGDVRDYARAAKRHLAPDGLFVFCFPWQQKARALRAAADEGFSVVAHRDVLPREGLAPLFSLFACRIGNHASTCEAPFVVRHADGGHTEALHEVRERFGWTRS